MSDDSHVGEMWEYIDDELLYLVLPSDDTLSYGRYKLLNLQNGSTPTITLTAFSDRPAAMKRWRRIA